MAFVKHLKSTYVLAGILLLVLCIAAACGPSDNSSGGSNSTTSSNGNATTTSSNGSTSTQGNASTSSNPVVVTPNSASGSSGTGPVVISAPTPAAGGKAGRQQVTLADRQVVINSVTKQGAASDATTTITLNVTVKNSSNNAIKNQAEFFQLMGQEGDAFGQSNSSDNFYGTISGHATRSGTIVFHIPTAAATKLRLMYRPEIASETVIMDLNV